eukprot:1615303-Rhodomonas_salina.5
MVSPFEFASPCFHYRVSRVVRSFPFLRDMPLQKRSRMKQKPALMCHVAPGVVFQHRCLYASYTWHLPGSFVSSAWPVALLIPFVAHSFAIAHKWDPDTN